MDVGDIYWCIDSVFRNVKMRFEVSLIIDIDIRDSIIIGIDIYNRFNACACAVFL